MYVKKIRIYDYLAVGRCVRASIYTGVSLVVMILTVQINSVNK